ncbi:DUF1752 domain-containing protein [Priestia megaterium]|nr:DUF1752 domain-containing protein [Priestia megaterium]
MCLIIVKKKDLRNGKRLQNRSWTKNFMSNFILLKSSYMEIVIPLFQTMYSFTYNNMMEGKKRSK